MNIIRYYIMIYEGLSAINNIKYHDITMKGYQINNIKYHDITYEGLSAINNIKYHDITL